MGRLGISYSDVERAVNAILEKNLNPTVDRIREILGTGSKNTILSHLRTWRAKQNKDSLHLQHSLPPELLTLVKNYVEQQQRSLSSNRALAVDSEYSILKHRLRDLELNRLILLQQKASLRTELKKLRDELSLV